MSARAAEFETTFDQQIGGLVYVPPNARAAVAYGVAAAWKEFLARFGTIAAFVQQTPAEQLEHLTSWNTARTNIARELNDEEVPLGMSFFQMYLTAIAAGDYEVARRMAQKLEPLNKEGWVLAHATAPYISLTGD